MTDLRKKLFYKELPNIKIQISNKSQKIKFSKQIRF